MRVRKFEARNEILKQARNLKDNDDFSKVYIAPDLTRKQQLLDKDLRTNRKKFKDEGQHENVRIEAGKVICDQGNEIKKYCINRYLQKLQCK